VHFIETYNESVSPDDCQKIIDYFESNPDKHVQGVYAIDGEVTVDRSVKDSTDMAMNLGDDNVCNEILIPVINFCTELYRESYPAVDKISNWSCDPKYNIQRYYPNQGYFASHCEDSSRECNRVMGWSLYLSTVTNGGFTVFDNYNLKIDSAAGKFCIFPAYWTHMHRGVPSPDQIKYIITGWYQYSDDEGFPQDDDQFHFKSWQD